MQNRKTTFIYLQKIKLIEIMPDSNPVISLISISRNCCENAANISLRLTLRVVPVPSLISFEIGRIDDRMQDAAR